MNKTDFNYIDFLTATVYYKIPCDTNAFVEVIGNGENGMYEWLIRVNNETEQHSNDGYGIPEIALRDGLIKYFGD